MNLLLVGNKGSFSKNIKKLLTKEFVIDFYEINKNLESKEIISQLTYLLKKKFFF